MTNSGSILLECLNLLSEPLCVIGENRQTLFANRAFSELLLNFDAEPPVTANYWPNNQKHPELYGEITTEIKRVDGQSILVRFEGCSLTAAGMYLLRVVSAQNASDEQSLFQSQRLETLGLLAGAVAHDFNNVLTGILGHAAYLKLILPPEGPHAESILAIEDGIKKGAALSAQVLNFSKVDANEPATEVSLHEMISKTLVLLRKAIPNRLKVTTNFHVKDVGVLATEGSLAQVLVNLVMNARDAIEDAGELEICLGVESDKEQLARIFHGSDLSSEQYAVLSVRDTGCGIETHLLDKIFQPFFTTKQEKGTGLGLHTALKIVTKLGGAMDISSKVGLGTVVSMYLPAQNVSEDSTEVKRQTLMRGSERVLIVDDEYAIRNVLSVSLQHLGYQVTALPSALEALHEIDHNGFNFDIVITDMLMPGMSGEEFYFSLMEKHPSAKVLIISGFAAAGSVERMVTHGAKGFIPKPFTIEELSQQVRRVIDAKEIHG